MRFSRHQLVKFAAKATGPSNVDLYGSLTQNGSYADRIAGLNPKKMPYADRLYMSGSPEGQALAAKYNIDVSPGMIAKMEGVRRQQQQMMATGPSPKSAPAARTTAAPAAPAAQVPQEGQAPLKLDIKMPASVAKRVAADTAAYKAKQQAKVTPGAPSATQAPSVPPSPTMEAPVDTSKPVVF